MNSYLNYKLSRKYKDFDFVNRVISLNIRHYFMYDRGLFLWEICGDFRRTLKRNQRIKYFRKLAKKIKNDDFDAHIENLENLCNDRVREETTRIDISDVLLNVLDSEDSD